MMLLKAIITVNCFQDLIKELQNQASSVHIDGRKVVCLKKILPAVRLPPVDSVLVLDLELNREPVDALCGGGVETPG